MPKLRIDPKCAYEIAMSYVGSGSCDFKKQHYVEELKVTLEHSQHGLVLNQIKLNSMVLGQRL